MVTGSSIPPRLKYVQRSRLKRTSGRGSSAEKSKCQPGSSASGCVRAAADAAARTVAFGAWRRNQSHARSSRSAGARSRSVLTSVECELFRVVRLQRRILLALAEHAIADDEQVELGPHEASPRILRGAHDRLAAHVEARVDEDPAPGSLLEPTDQLVIPRIRLSMHRLDARREVDVRHCGDRRARHVEL